jgi:hypothetical protein
MKLELKHLAPYLPYEVKSVHYFKGLELIKEIDCANVYGFVNGDTLHKPILRPLSDLTRLNNINGRKFCPITYIEESYAYFDTKQIFHLINNGNWLNNCDYLLIQYLFEWHFDVFGLIEAGLAIDINTLND